MLVHVAVSVVVTIFLLILIMAFSFLRNLAGFGTVTPTGPAAWIAGKINPAAVAA